MRRLLLGATGAGLLIQVASRLARPLSASEFEWLHAAWLIGLGKLPYRDFELLHPPALAYLLALPVGLSGDQPMLMLGLVRLLSLALTLIIARQAWLLAERFAALASAASASTGIPGVAAGSLAGPAAAAMLLAACYTLADNGVPLGGALVATALSAGGLLLALSGHSLASGLVTSLSVWFYQSPVPLVAPLLAVLFGRRGRLAFLAAATAVVLPAALLIPAEAVISPHLSWFPINPWVTTVRLLVQDGPFWWLGLGGLIALTAMGARLTAPVWAVVAASFGLMLAAPKALPHHMLPVLPLLAGASGAAWSVCGRPGPAQGGPGRQLWPALTVLGGALTLGQLLLGGLPGWAGQARMIARAQVLVDPGRPVLDGSGMAYNRPHGADPWYLPPVGRQSYEAIDGLIRRIEAGEVPVVMLDEHLFRLLTVPVRPKMVIGSRVLAPRLPTDELEALDARRLQLAGVLQDRYLRDPTEPGIRVAGVRTGPVGPDPVTIRLPVAGLYQVSHPGLLIDGWPASGTIRVPGGTLRLTAPEQLQDVEIRYIGP